MRKEVDARGKACLEPVVLTKKALEGADEITRPLWIIPLPEKTCGVLP